MAATLKVDLINGAFSQMRISGLTVNPGGRDYTTALERLENMAYMLQSRGIVTNYNFTETPDPNDLTNVPMALNLMFQSNLALQLCPDFGKEIPQSLAMLATSTMATASAVSALALVQDVQYPRRMPIGSGNSLRWQPLNNYNLLPPNPPPNPTTHTLYIGDIDSYNETWEQYLRAGETVDSFTIAADEGLFLSSSSLSTPIVTFEVQGVSQQVSGRWQQVKIIVTTSLGRVNTRFVNFNVIQANTVGSN